MSPKIPKRRRKRATSTRSPTLTSWVTTTRRCSVSKRTTTRTKRRAGEEEEDEDDELLSPDDVEADLDRILKDRLVTAEDEDEDEDEEEPDDRGEQGDRLQPKRADEQLYPNCFLLVRSTAPGCPVGDDACPIFG